MKIIKMLYGINFFFIIISIFLSASDILQIFFYDKQTKYCFNVPHFDKKSLQFRFYWFGSRLITTLSA
jgi:hypothetical protein